MNLAVHGLEGDIHKAITYYEDPHELLGKADFVMANPPFNVDEIDADKIKNDPRLPFGLPGVNKKGAVSNGNYIWISYFYSYLNENGRSGFVMSSQASSAGRDEAKVRRKLIEAGHVDVMIAIRPNFFYTRSVPCELWFLDRAKPLDKQDKVLMIDARNIYRKVTRKINDFSPEHLKNLASIVWLYRGHGDRFLDLVVQYLRQTLHEAHACFETKNKDGEAIHPLADYQKALTSLKKAMQPFLDTLPNDATHAEVLLQQEEGSKTFELDVDAFRSSTDAETAEWEKQERDNPALNEATKRLAPMAETSRNLVKQADLLFKLACRLIDVCERELAARESDLWVSRDITRNRKAADEARQVAVDQLKQVRYLHKQATWLTDRFPAGMLRDVEGLVKLVDRAELEANDWGLTPGRYVGVAPEEEDEDFDFEEALRNIHIELEGLNAEAVELTAKIKKNFEELGV
jgi:type I restriction enzyme M protein